MTGTAPSKSTAKLRIWADEVERMFRGVGGPYLVGSVLARPDWRDVDVRMILPDVSWRQLNISARVLDLNHAISEWGRGVTGLPIDFQVQPQTEADTYDGRRDPLMDVYSMGGFEEQWNPLPKDHR